MLHPLNLEPYVGWDHKNTVQSSNLLFWSLQSFRVGGHIWNAGKKLGTFS